MSKTILLIHGAWLTPAIWQPWIVRYKAQGLHCSRASLAIHGPPYY